MLRVKREQLVHKVLRAFRVLRVKREQPVHKVCKVLRALRVKREQPVHKVLRAFRVFRVFKVQRGMVLMLKIPETPTNLQSGIYRIIR